MNKTSITFDEKMSGAFVQGVTDPEQGAERGKASNSEFTMHATISAPDLDALASDPDHTGQLQATVDYTPFGKNIATTNGVFKLFTRPDQGGTKNMIYEFCLRHNGEDYFFHGHKNVRNDAHGTDLWKDTTTLYSTLHQGKDRSGPVVGAGILTLGLLDVMKLASTMRAMNGGGVEETATAVAKFGKVFLGELWDTYAKPLAKGL